MMPPAPPVPAPRMVPSHEVEVLIPRRHRYCVAVFVLDEGERLLRQLDRMTPHAGGIDVVIADGGSTDGSVAPENMRPRGVSAILTKTGPGRLGAQMRMAFAYALDAGYDGVVTMDGNDKDDPAALPAFVAALEAGCDHVQGSRFIPGGHHENTPLSRRLGIRLVHAPLIRRAAGFPYTDTTNGFRAYSRGFLADPRVAVFRDVFTGYELHYYLAIRAARLGYRVQEIPVSRTYPAHGRTPTKISPLRGNLRVLRVLFRACRGAYDPKP